MNGGLLLEGPDGYGPAPEPGPHLREAWDEDVDPVAWAAEVRAAVAAAGSAYVADGLIPGV